MSALDDTHERFRHWFGEDYDLESLDAALAVAAVEKFTDGSDPLWLLLVGGSGGCKTETVTPLKGAGALVVSTITSAGALLSGTAKKEQAKGATGGLLRQLGPRRGDGAQRHDLDPVAEPRCARRDPGRIPRNLRRLLGAHDRQRRRSRAGVERPDRRSRRDHHVVGSGARRHRRDG